MPLTYVVEHLNRCLTERHPASILASNSGLLYEGQRLSARINGIRIEPVQIPVYRTDGLALFAQDTRLAIRGRDSAPLNAPSLYLQAWDHHDVMYLDRLLRTLHALHHVSLHDGNAQAGRLILDVHPRHLQAVPAHHGLVFEQLLGHLGLRPEAIILRLACGRLAPSAQLRRAIENFAGRGYGLMLQVADVECDSLAQVRALGVSILSVNARALSHDLAGWTREARRLGLLTLVEDSGGSVDRGQARDLGIALIEGDGRFGADPRAVSRQVGRLHPPQCDDTLKLLL